MNLPFSKNGEIQQSGLNESTLDIHLNYLRQCHIFSILSPLKVYIGLITSYPLFTDITGGILDHSYMARRLPLWLRLKNPPEMHEMGDAKFDP